MALKSIIIAVFFVSTILTCSWAADSPTTEIKVTILGNSLTLHEPAPGIGWNQRSGMAASDLDHDYVHILITMMMEREKASKVTPRIINGFDFENTPDAVKLTEIVEAVRGADIFIIQLGDNVKEQMVKPFLSLYSDLIAEIRKSNSKSTLIALGTWYDKRELNRQIKEICDTHFIKHVDLAPLFDDKNNLASSERSFSNPAVGSHPGDKGMKEIANAITTVLYQR